MTDVKFLLKASKVAYAIPVSQLFYAVKFGCQYFTAKRKPDQLFNCICFYAVFVVNKFEVFLIATSKFYFHCNNYC